MSRLLLEGEDAAKEGEEERGEDQAASVLIPHPQRQEEHEEEEEEEETKVDKEAEEKEAEEKAEGQHVETEEAENQKNEKEQEQMEEAGEKGGREGRNNNLQLLASTPCTPTQGGAEGETNQSPGVLLRLSPPPVTISPLTPKPSVSPQFCCV